MRRYNAPLYAAYIPNKVTNSYQNDRIWSPNRDGEKWTGTGKMLADQDAGVAIGAVVTGR
jgi:hypothetical protein